MKKIIGNSLRDVRFCDSVSEAIEPVKSGDTIFMGGFDECGLPNALCESLAERKDEVKDLTIIATTACVDNWGAGLLANHGMVKRLCASYIGECDNVIEKYWNGNIEIEFIPLGTISELFRTSFAGIPAFFTPTGVGTLVEDGGLVIKHDSEGNPEILSDPKETREIDGKKYLMEEMIVGDIGFVKGWKADRNGNVVCRGSALNVNPDVAMGSSYTICEVEEIVEIGELDPAEIHIPNIFIDVIFCPPPYEKQIGFETFQQNENDESDEQKMNLTKEDMKDFPDLREKVARRLALEYQDGMYANVGIGIPSMSANYIPSNVDITLQQENGILGLGPYPKTREDMDPDYMSPGRQTITILPGSSLFSCSDSFGMIRGGHIDMTALGSLQVSQNGDIANWIIPGKLVKGMGGAMDLCSLNVVACMLHNNPKDGSSKVLKECTLPLTGEGVVSRLITDIAVFDFEEDDNDNVEMILVEKAWWVDVEEIIERTEAQFIVSKEISDIEYSFF